MAGALAVAGLAAGAGPAAAEPTGRLDTAFADKGNLNVALAATDGLDSLEIDPDSITVSATVDDRTVELEPKVRAAAADTKRVAVLVLDTSLSMTPPRLAAAKDAAYAFLQAVPPDVSVGLVTFGDPAQPLSDPTTDRAAIRKKIQGLKAAGDTAMYEAVVFATRMFGTAATRSIVLLSDGKNDDTVGRTVDARAGAAALRSAKATITAVVVGDDPGALPDVREIVPQDRIIEATDERELDELTETFKNEGDAIGNTVLFTAELPDEWATEVGSLRIEATTSDGTPLPTITGNYFPRERAPAAAAPAAAPQVVEADPRLTAVTTPVVVVAIIALFGALCIMVATATGALARDQDEESEVVRRLAVYTFSGREARRAAVAEQTTALGNSAMARGAVDLAERLARGRHVERWLDGRLDDAGLPLRTAEWTVIHVGTAVVTTLLFLLIGAGSIFAGLLGLVLGLVAPWLFLVVRQSRREAAFLGQLPDTLQLLAGSLQAGYSLPQAMDTVVREAKPPIGTEFNRALIEARLGVPPEDALEGIANRTGSRDFSWIVMAIRIQRDVGGNLAELLGSVAETLRERERLRRQVSALSAEGRLSGIILAALPLIFTVYLLLVQPDYLRPMFTTAQGILLLVFGAILLALGGFWMSRVVKVQV
jgi:tight adherence protein B